MTTISLFSPLLPSDVDPEIYKFCDNETVADLSCVNKQANANLSIAEFFHKRFCFEHPHLIKETLNLILSPFNYWKSLCKIFDPFHPNRYNHPSDSPISNAIKLEDDLKRKSRLLECVKQIKDLIEHPKLVTQDTIERIRNLVDSLGTLEYTDSDCHKIVEIADLTTNIWTELHQKQGIQGDKPVSWSKANFQNFLPQLNTIILGKLSLINKVLDMQRKKAQEPTFN